MQDPPSRYTGSGEEAESYRAFLNFQAPEGLYFLQYLQRCSEAEPFRWTYYPPETFRILLWFPEDGSFALSSQLLERYAFNSCYTAELTELSVSGSETVFSVRKSGSYWRESLSFLARAAATVVLEIGVALLFGYRQRGHLRLILAANLVTQTLLNLGLSAADYYFGPWMLALVYVLAELAVFAAEAVFYKRAFSRLQEEQGLAAGRPVWYAIAANLLSFAAGVAAARWLPGVF